MAERMHPLPTNFLPCGPELMRDFSWVDGYLETRRLLEKLGELRRRRAEIQQAPPVLEDMLGQAREAYLEYRRRRVETLRSVLREQAARGCYTFRLPAHESFIAWDEVEEAVRGLAVSETALPEQKRKRALERIEREIAGVCAELAQYNDPQFFVFEDGRVRRDLREEFVAHWAGVQRRCSEPVDPCGIALDLCLERVQDAWRRLGLGECVNPYARWKAARPGE